jgi:hypothetical protein
MHSQKALFSCSILEALCLGVLIVVVVAAVALIPDASR